MIKKNVDFQRKMKEKIKLYSHEEYLDGYVKNEFLTEDGDADIFLKIENKDELFDTWTMHDQVDLENDVYSYIEEKTSMLDNDIQINLHIVGGNLSTHEKDTIKHILKEHYAIELYKVQRKYNNIKKKIFGLIIIGLLSLLGYGLLYLYTEFDFFMEVFGFLFSFSLWEGFDAYIYSFNEVKLEREAVTQNLLMIVDFE